MIFNMPDIMNYKFNVEKVTNECIEWIREWFNNVNPTGKAVIGISGGKDSSVTAALCVKALGKDRVIGVLMPNHIQNDIEYSHLLCEHLGIKNYTIDVGVAIDELLSNIHFRATDIEISNQTKINLPARIRMSTLYAIAQSVNGIVANTCNLSEDHVGYSTLFGDMSGSFSPLGGLTVAEVKAIGRYLGLPTELIDKVPSDGLCGKTDEDNLGFTYEELDNYIRTGKITNLKHKNKIDTLYEQNKFKLKMLHIDTFEPNISSLYE